MKATIAILAFLPSCTVIHGDRNQGTYTYATLGGDAKELAQTADGITVASLDTSPTFREVSAAAKNYIWAGALKSVAKTAGQSLKSITKSKEATKQTGLTEKGLTDRAGIAADVEKAKIEAEAVQPEF